MEAAFKQIPFPGSEIDMHVSDYAKLICAMCDIPVHKSAKNNTAIESLHVLFTLFSEFRSNQHFQQQAQETPGGVGGAGGNEDFANFWVSSDHNNLGEHIVFNSDILSRNLFVS